MTKVTRGKSGLRIDLRALKLDVTSDELRADKKQYEALVVKRGVEDCTWVAPSAALGIEIDFQPPFAFLNGAVVYKPGFKEATLPVSVHSWPALDPITFPNGVDLWYTIKVFYAIGTLEIDPMVEILP